MTQKVIDIIMSSDKELVTIGLIIARKELGSLEKVYDYLPKHRSYAIANWSDVILFCTEGQSVLYLSDRKNPLYISNFGPVEELIRRNHDKYTEL